MKTQGLHYLMFACMIYLGFCVASLLPAKAQELNSSSGPIAIPGHGCTAPRCGAGTPDPDCGNAYARCQWITVTVPQTAQNIRAVPTASKESVSWVDCPAVPNGAKYPFMDCAKNLGWIRFLQVQPKIVTDSSGAHVSWQAINWASYQQYGKVTVYYTLPKTQAETSSKKQTKKP